MTKETKTEVAEVKTGALVAAEFMDASDFQGAGFEGADQSSYAIPFLQILQKMSPQVDEDDSKHIEGAKAGMLYNTVTGKVYDGKAGLTIIPCAFKRSFILWGGREGDGGFKGEFTPEAIAELMKDPTKIVEIKGRLYVPNEDGTVDPQKNDYYADTRSHYILTVDESGEIGQAILSLSSSQIKSSKMLMTALSQRLVDTPNGKMRPPTFANTVLMTTKGMQNDKGSWSGAAFSVTGLVADRDLYNAAKEFYKAFTQGDVNVDYSKSAPDSEAAAGETPEDAEKF